MLLSTNCTIVFAYVHDAAFLKHHTTDLGALLSSFTDDYGYVQSPLTVVELSPSSMQHYVVLRTLVTPHFITYCGPLKIKLYRSRESSFLKRGGGSKCC